MNAAPTLFFLFNFSLLLIMCSTKFSVYKTRDAFRCHKNTMQYHQVNKVKDKGVHSWFTKKSCLTATDVTCHMGSHKVTCHPTQVNASSLNHSQQAGTRVWIPGLPFPGRPGIPVIFRSRIPGNVITSFPWKTGTVRLMVLLPFSACLCRPWYSDADG